MEYRRISSLSDVTGKGKSKRKENENETKNSNVNSKKISPTVRYVSPYFHYDRDTNIIVITKRKENENETCTETETSTAVRYVSPYFRNESDNNIIVLPKKKNENETETSTAVRYVSRFFHNNSKKNINVIVVDKKRKTLSTSEMSKDAYKRKAADNTWMPPKSPHQLLQEYHAHDPWRVLVICMFLNVTCGPQEDMKKQLNAEGNYTEEELEEYMQSHKKLMIDSLWKLNVADIEATLSRVCQMVLQDNSAKKEELRARAKGLKTLGKIFQRVKPANGNENESVLNKAVHKLNGSETSNDACSASTSPKSSSPDFSTDAISVSQSPYVEAPHFAGMQFDYNFPRPTAPPGAQRPPASKD